MAWPNRGLVHRPVVMGTRGMVASAHFLASVAGLRILTQGGNAVDAAVATAAALNVCEPFMSGIGGIGYMVVYTAKDQRVRVLDYVGRAPRAATPAAFASKAEKDHGPKSPIVPGAAGGWLMAHDELGRLERAAVFAPAIEYAEQGIPISLKNETFYRSSFAGGYLEPETLAIFFPGGKVPLAGTIIRQPQLAATFRDVVEGGPDAFYRGSIARRIALGVQEKGGLLTEEDLAAFQPAWQETISTSYRGYVIHCPPPPSSGIQYLETFNILEAFDLAATGQNSPETIHLMAEAIKLASADRIAYAPVVDSPVSGLLSKEYAAERRRAIDPYQAARAAGERFDGRLTDSGTIPPGKPAVALPESTTHFTVIDGDGNGVSVTQTLGDGFGSGVVAGDTGVVLNNFCYWFDLDPASPNLIAPQKRVEMCLAPPAVLRDGKLFMVIGTPGSFGIMQTTPQMISNVLDHGFNIQAAIEAPRFRTYEGTTIEIEARVPKATRDQLIVRGHAIRLIDDWSPHVGGGQGIMIDPDSGALMGGADPRRDGYALGW